MELRPELLERRRDSEARAVDDEERRCPAFWRVFCRVMSLSEGLSRASGPGGGLKEEGETCDVGEIWEETP